MCNCRRNKIRVERGITWEETLALNLLRTRPRRRVYGCPPDIEGDRLRRDAWPIRVLISDMACGYPSPRVFGTCRGRCLVVRRLSALPWHAFTRKHAKRVVHHRAGGHAGRVRMPRASAQGGSLVSESFLKVGLCLLGTGSWKNNLPDLGLAPQVITCRCPGPTRGPHRRDALWLFSWCSTRGILRAEGDADGGRTRRGLTLSTWCTR